MMILRKISFQMEVNYLNKDLKFDVTNDEDFFRVFSEGYNAGAEVIELKVFINLMNEGMSIEKAQSIIGMSNNETEKFLKIIEETT